MQKVIVGGAEAVPDNNEGSKRNSLKESPALSNIEEEGHEETGHPEGENKQEAEEEKEEGEMEEETEKVKRGVSFEDDVFGKQEEAPVDPQDAKEDGESHKEGEEASRRTSMTSLGVISSEEYVPHKGEEIESPRRPSLHSLAEGAASRSSKRSSKASIIEPEDQEEILPEEAEEEDNQGSELRRVTLPLMDIPQIAKHSPSPVEGQASLMMPVIPRPKSARPRGSADGTKMPNGELAMGNGNLLRGSSSLSMEAVPVSEVAPGQTEDNQGEEEEKEEREDEQYEEGKEDWTSEGSGEEVWKSTSLLFLILGELVRHSGRPSLFNGGHPHSCCR